MNTIVLSDHARNRLKQRLGLPKRALNRFITKRVNAGEVVDEEHLHNRLLRQDAATMRQGRADRWVTWDPKYKIFYIWAVARRALILVTVVFAGTDGRWWN